VLANDVSLLRHHTFDLSANALASVILFTHTHVLESPGSERWDSVGEVPDGESTLHLSALKEEET